MAVLRTQRKSLIWLIMMALLQFTTGQDYGNADPYYEQEYAQDNLYHDYAARQQEKSYGGAVAGGGGGGWKWAAGGGVVGWWLGSTFHCRRQKKKIEAKHKADHKALYQQYYEDVYALQLQNAELIQALEQLGVKIKK